MNYTHPSLAVFRRAFATLLFAGLTAISVHAGPPLICHPYDIGEAKSLPGGSMHGTDPAYDRTHLVRDTLALLTPEASVLVRMETLRRAAIYTTANMRGWDEGTAYTTDDRQIAAALLEQLRLRTVHASPSDCALALFDLGFFSETLRQAHLNPALDGYALLREALDLRGADPEMEFALALASVHPKRVGHAEHLALARAGAKSGTLLAVNLATHFNR